MFGEAIEDLSFNFWYTAWHTSNSFTVEIKDDLNLANI